MDNSNAPRLVIRYSPQFSIVIQLLRIQHYEAVLPEYYFEVTCRVSHPTGEFTYVDRDVCFDIRTFKKFGDQLEAIRSGISGVATLDRLGGITRFTIEHRNRKTTASIRINEFQADNEPTLLSAGFEVDYDLFVNALYRETLAFCKELEQLHHKDSKSTL